MVSTLRTIAIQVKEDLKYIIGKACETLPVVPRIEEARERIPDETYMSGLINILRGFGGAMERKDARELSILYSCARGVADLPAMNL